MIMGYSFYEIAALFFVYGFLGWVVEVIFRGLCEGRFVNSGFLNGPICPIYGFGGVIVVLCLTPVQDNIPVLFICSAILTTGLELITGFALDKIFHTRWWDYTDKPFNIGGYICLQFMVAWGLVCVGLMKILHPPVIQLIRAVPFMLGVFLLIFVAVVFIADVVVTVITINHLANRLKIMDEIAASIHAVSDNIGTKVYNSAETVKAKGGNVLESKNARVIKEKYSGNVEELKQRYKAMTEERHRLQNRILKAFPKMTSRH
ncbi:MAG: putative ABC transporter permease, partial [Clostridia bacterium]|nr:putative ABC transporter permease [Clostridia bacterium]